MEFLSVAGIPSFLEERAVFMREWALFLSITPHPLTCGQTQQRAVWAWRLRYRQFFGEHSFPLLMCRALLRHMVSDLSSWVVLVRLIVMFNSYWAIGLYPGAIEFFRFLSFLFIAIYIAEAQVSMTSLPTCAGYSLFS
jgi:hypothetical protein